ncbi:hypothetical protein HDU78_000538 [Chytriomyces hyalinus]|nr:hypothetical protein HDU78_000538 [Chytriomyces hyalinus]
MSIPSSVADCDNKSEPRFSLPESTLHRPLAARERVESVPSNHAEIGSPYPDVIEIRRTLERPARPSKSSSNGTRASSLIVCPSESREIEPMNNDLYTSTTLDHNRPETVTRPFSLTEVPGEAEVSKRGENGLLETSLRELDKSAEQQFNKMLSSSAPDLLEARFTLRKGHDRVKLDHLVLTDAMYDLVLDLAQWIKDPCTKYSQSRKARNEFYREMCFYLFILLIALLGTVVWMLPPFSTHVYLEGGVSEDIHFEIWYLVSRIPLMVISMALFIQFCIVIYQVHPPPLLQLLAYAISLVLDYQLLSMAVAKDYTPGGITSFFQTHFQIVSGISLVLALLPPAGIVLVAYYLVRQKSNKRLSGISLHMDENEEQRTPRDFFLSLVSFQETANREGRTYGRSEFIGLLLMSAWGFATYIWCQVFTWGFARLENKSFTVSLFVPVAYTFTLWLLRRAGVLISRAFIRAELFKTAIFPIYASEVYAFMFSRNMLLSVDTVEMMLILEVGRVIVDDILRFMLPFTKVYVPTLKCLRLIPQSTTVLENRLDNMWHSEIRSFLGFLSILVFLINAVCMHNGWNRNLFQMTEKTYQCLAVVLPISLLLESTQWIWTRQVIMRLCRSSTSFSLIWERRFRPELMLILLVTVHAAQSAVGVQLLIPSIPMYRSVHETHDSE